MKNSNFFLLAITAATVVQPVVRIRLLTRLTERFPIQR